MEAVAVPVCQRPHRPGWLERIERFEAYGVACVRCGTVLWLAVLDEDLFRALN